MTRELVPGNFESLLRYLSRLSDSGLREVKLEWGLVPRCWLTFGWWEGTEEYLRFPQGIAFEVRELSRFYWADNFNGSVECGVLVLKYIRHRAYLAIGGEDTTYNADSDFSPATTSMYAVGSRIVLLTPLPNWEQWGEGQ